MNEKKNSKNTLLPPDIHQKLAYITTESSSYNPTKSTSNTQIYLTKNIYQQTTFILLAPHLSIVTSEFKFHDIADRNPSFRYHQHNTIQIATVPIIYTLYTPSITHCHQRPKSPLSKPQASLTNIPPIHYNLISSLNSTSLSLPSTSYLPPPLSIFSIPSFPSHLLHITTSPTSSTKQHNNPLPPHLNNPTFLQLSSHN